MKASVHRAKCSQFSYDVEIAHTMLHLHTNNNKFMLPTVLSCYRKGINPVKANYQYLQDALIFNESKFKMWFIQYVNESNMIVDMLSALDNDIHILHKLLQKYKCMCIHNEATLQLDKLHNDFRNIKIGLEEYYRTLQ